uniref:Putative odorant-binding protein 1 n=1 Tax=Dichelops melacanthus TaxID=1225065 RepID=A0A097QH80_9HEMI|nr:putative odorant-binding protein 1 [Dichelops melacanthus]
MEKAVGIFLVFFMACALIEESNAAMSEAQMKNAMKTLRNMCMPKSGVSKEALASMKEGNFDDDDRKLKCYLGCIMNMMQVVKNGKISMTMVKNQITKMVDPTWGAKLVATFESCSNVEGSDNCDLAYISESVFMKLTKMHL